MEIQSEEMRTNHVILEVIQKPGPGIGIEENLDVLAHEIVVLHLVHQRRGLVKLLDDALL